MVPGQRGGHDAMVNVNDRASSHREKEVGVFPVVHQGTGISFGSTCHATRLRRAGLVNGAVPGFEMMTKAVPHLIRERRVGAKVEGGGREEKRGYVG